MVCSYECSFKKPALGIKMRDEVRNTVNPKSALEPIDPNLAHSHTLFSALTGGSTSSNPTPNSIPNPEPKEDGRVYLTQLNPDVRAATNARVGDEVTSINGASVVGLGLRAFKAKLRDTPARPVVLTVQGIRNAGSSRKARSPTGYEYE